VNAAKPSATIWYTMLRVGIFIGSLVFVGLLVQFGVLPKGLGHSNFIWVILLALVISAPLSFVLLRKQRDAMSVQLVNKVESAKAKLEANRSQEDGVVQ
jgi:prolipoprotein diacylglyceryltransferase